MARQPLVPALALRTAVVACAWTIAASVQAKTIELKNDSIVDNSQGKAICGFNVGEGFGVRFTPPAFPAKLLKVRVLLTNVGLSATQTVCAKVPIADQIPIGLEISHLIDAAPGTSLASISDLGVSNDTVFNEFDLGAEKLLIDDGSFFVAFTLQADNAAPLIDQGSPPGDGNYLYGDIGQGLKWYPFAALGASAPKGNWAVRAIVEVPDDDAGGPSQDAAAGDAAQEVGADGSALEAGASDAGMSDEAGPDAGPLPPPEAAEGGGCGIARGRAGSLAALAIAALALWITRRRRD